MDQKKIAFPPILKLLLIIALFPLLKILVPALAILFVVYILPILFIINLFRVN